MRKKEIKLCRKKKQSCWYQLPRSDGADRYQLVCKETEAGKEG